MGELIGHRRFQIRNSSPGARQLVAEVLPGHDKDERVTFLYGHICRSDDVAVVFPRQLVHVDDQDYAIKDKYRVRLRAAAVNRVYEDFSQSAFNCLISAHSHPFESGHLGFSGLDDENDRFQSRFFYDEPLRWRRTFGTGDAEYLHLLVGSAGQMRARIFDPASGLFRDASKVTCLGQPVRVFTPNGTAADRVFSEVQDRAHRAFGQDRFAVMKGIKLVVVGAGTLGAAFGEGAARLGVGSIVFVDHDAVELSNLGRLQGVGVSDVARLKADVQVERIRGFGLPGVEIRAVNAPAQSREALSEMLDADAIVGCVDNHRARAFLNAFSVKHLVPFIDLATRVIPEENRVSVPVRVSVVVPTVTSCMSCSSVTYWDPAAEFDSGASTQTKRIAKSAGYILGRPDEPAPAVYPQAMLAAGAALLELLNLWLGYKEPYWNAYFDYSQFHQAVDEVASLAQVRNARARKKEGCVLCDCNSFDLGLPETDEEV